MIKLSVKSAFYASFLILPLLFSCTKKYEPPDLGELYTRSAREYHKYGNPVIVIPGILGSRLVVEKSGTVVWGAFDNNYADPGTPEGARLIAHPLYADSAGDGIVSNGALDRVKVNLLGIPLELNAYVNILSTLGAGGYRDDSFSLSNVDYGTEHFSCFQFDYDWRLDNVENAMRLHAFILEKKEYVETQLSERYGIERDVKFDIVAHSMGGLIARYYLMYGSNDLDAVIDLDEPGWEGAEYVENLIVIGTPNAGSLNAMDNLINGRELGPFLPRYESSIIGSMPSVYQLLTRNRHKLIVDENGKAIDLYDPGTWKKLGWGLADPDQEEIIAMLLPEVADSGDRNKIAMEYLAYVLQRADSFQRALDVPAEAPEGVKMYLIAGDSVPTDSSYVVDSKTGKIIKRIMSHGDGTVTRSSALLDERIGGEWKPYVVTPIDWTNVMFIFSDHLGITKDPTFSDNVLFLLLENPSNSERTEG